MVYIPDLAPYSYLGHYVETIVAIGWLSSEHDFVKGTVPDDVIARLQAFRESPAFTTFGFHSCELCDNAISSTEILVQGKEKVYLAPEMIVHYIQEHQYCPPTEFIEAVRDSEFVDGKPKRVILTKKPDTDPWSSSMEMTARQFVQAHKKPEIIVDDRWFDDLAEETLFYIYDEGSFGDERCALMTTLLKDSKYNRK